MVDQEDMEDTQQDTQEVDLEEDPVDQEDLVTPAETPCTVKQSDQ